jgi:RND superfamily putative drug exporter
MVDTPPAIDACEAEYSAQQEPIGQAAMPAVPGSGADGSRRRPLTERIACWSARHAVLALAGWLLMVGGALLAGHLYGTQSQPQYDPGPSGVAERMLDRMHVVTPPSESVLIQARIPGPGHTYGADPAMRQATRDVVAALRGLPGTAARVRSPLGPGGRQMIAPHGAGALITFQVAGPHGNADGASRAPGTWSRRFRPGIRTSSSEAGGASIDRPPTR